jgi:hypothetical protein
MAGNSLFREKEMDGQRSGNIASMGTMGMRDTNIVLREQTNSLRA